MATTPRGRPLTLALVLLGLFGAGGGAFAQDPPGKRVVVLKFTGTQAQRARAAVIGGLGRWATLVDEEEFSAALSRARGATRPDRIATACQTVGVDAVVEGTMHRSRRTWGVEVIVRNCENGEKMSPGGRAVYSMRNLGGIGVIRGTIWDRIGDAIAATGGGGSSSGTRVATTSRSRSRSNPSPPARAVSPSRTTPSRTTPSRTANAAAMECLFTEDEPPEGFPSHGAWVRRRNEFLVNCERERTRRIAEERRRREEAARRAEEERRRRAEEARLAREAEERRQREEEERQVREEEDRRRRAAEAEDRRRREEEERRAEADRIEREARRRALEDARREEEARLDDSRRFDREREEEERRRREEADLNRRVAEYRERLREERGMRADAADVSTRSDVEPRDYDYEEADRDHDREESDYDSERSERDHDDRDPVYDPSREEEEEEDRWRRRRDHDDEDADRDRAEEDEEEEEDEPEPRSLRRRRPVIFDIGAGVAFMSRNMSVEVAGSDKPRTYSAPGYPELTVHAEFFPVALASPTSGAAGLGIFGLYRRHLFLETSGPTDLGETINVATSEQELLVGAMFRTAMGRSPASPVVTLAAGYGYFAFELDPQAMSLLKEEVQMPTMIYRNLVVNAALTIPISGSTLGVEVGGSYRYVVDVGQAARDLFGADTTGGNGFAGRAALGGEATFIAEGVTWSLSGDYTVFSTKFSGATTAGDSIMDGFPSGTDRYLRGLFLAAYRFR